MHVLATLGPSLTIMLAPAGIVAAVTLVIYLLRRL